MTTKEQNKLSRMILYEQIHRYHAERKSARWIADRLKINPRTVKKYLSMSQAEFERHSDNINRKGFKLQRYTTFVVERLKKYQDTPAAQMHDLLKEHYPDFPAVSPKTVYNYVMKIRQEHGLPVVSASERQYSCIPETAPGRYAQVDFGQMKLRKGDGTRIRVYFMVMILCWSRFKYAWFQDRPFTSESASLAHEKAFEYFHGVPGHIIYDQDAVFLYDENIGDYRMTTVFESYVKSRPFKPVFCRPADPESKGKVENAVKYVKHNFLLNRQYSTLENLQEEAEAWLSRTGNGMVHSTTMKVPQEQWYIECRSLLPHIPLALSSGTDAGHQVMKTNSVRYRGNIYTLPIGTYKGEGSVVYLKEEGVSLVITDSDGHEIARHIMPSGSGQKVINSNHLRDRSVKLSEYRKKVEAMFGDSDAASLFAARLQERYPRYLRDQLAVLQECMVSYGRESCDKALAICCENRLFSASSFREIAEGLRPAGKDTAHVTVKTVGNGRSRMMANFQPGTSSIDTYNNLFTKS